MSQSGFELEEKDEFKFVILILRMRQCNYKYGLIFLRNSEMSTSSKESNAIGKITVAVVIAFLTGASAPWWWEYLVQSTSIPSSRWDRTMPTPQEDIFWYEEDGNAGIRGAL